MSKWLTNVETATCEIKFRVVLEIREKKGAPGGGGEGSNAAEAREKKLTQQNGLGRGRGGTNRHAKYRHH